MSSIDTFIIQYGLLAVFLIMLTKTAGVPIPIPGDLIILTAATGVAQGKLVGWQVFLAIFIALVLGGFTQFVLARSPGRGLLERFGRFIGLTKPRLESVAEKVRTGGAIGLALAILIPGIRGVAIVAAGLANLPLRRFLPGLVLGSLLFLSLHFFLGYLGGSALAAIGKVVPVPLVLVLVPILLAVAYILWVIAFRRQNEGTVGPGTPQFEQSNAAALEVWHEGICPVCLALYSARQIRSLRAKSLV